jgi:peptidyl-prolyl cis-trans isomerase B (cyclophilin B)
MQLRLLLLLAALVALLAAGCGGDDDSASGSTATTAAPAATAAETGGGDSGGGDSGCEQVAAPEPKPEGTLKAPTEPLGPGEYRAVVRTNCGDFTITLDPKASPKTVASFVSLADQGFFDDTTFHRIVPGFVIQGGDPTGTGTGGPGYSTVDTPAQSTTYTLGTVAMAKTQTEAPGTSGSQFFVVTAEDAGLPPEYAVIGKVTEGMDVVSAIGLLGDPSSELPLQPVVIETIDIEKP